MVKQEKGLFCSGGGCTAKLGSASLKRVLERIPRKQDEDLLVGFESSDDAAVYRLSPELAVVHTLDFFPPVVEDPELYGQIAAANALSDIYAMGAEVRTALNIVCFPEKEDLNLLGKVIQGGAQKVEEAGGILAGGHSISDSGIKYGLSVTGTVHPDKIWRNNGCQRGDLLLLTKPLGVGIICAADRVGEASKEAMEKAIRSMTTLNKAAADVLREFQVHACTDVTGFGFLGHLREMLGSDHSARIWAEKLPYFKEAYEYAGNFLITAAAQRNRNALEHEVDFQEVSFEMEELLFDPQTSGGLLVSLGRDTAEKAAREMKEQGVFCAIVGEITEQTERKITVKGEGRE